MAFIYSASAINSKYGSAAGKIVQQIQTLGSNVDVSGQSAVQVQASIAALPPEESACLIGGYDLVPTFLRDNPTFHLVGDDDVKVPTDAPYGATPGTEAEEYAPTRAVSRIPDSGRVDATDFLAILTHQLSAPTRATTAGRFEEAAEEFDGALKYVSNVIPPSPGAYLLSPTSDENEPGLTTKIAGHGRIHILLHGANYDPDWSYLWGHDGHSGAPFIKALSAKLFDLCDMQGSVVTFSSCYAAMLDVAPATSGARTSSNQVALACLRHGAKSVFAATRSNWIGTSAPFDAYGPRLIAEVWKAMAGGTPAAEALRVAKRAYLKDALSGSSQDRPYAYKTVLQAHCFGHPDATL